VIWLAVLAYLVIGVGFAWLGIRHDWTLFATRYERRPDAALMVLFWPAWAFVVGAGLVLHWIVSAANPTAYKRNH
jgi:hypothetical protein